MRKTELFAALAAVLIASPVMAQGRGRGNGGVPPGQRPSAGMCRIWIDGVPPGQQPAQTDCATAAARVPRNGRVIYGDRTTNDLRGIYDPNNRGGVYDPNNRDVYDRNGQVARRDGRECVQRADQNGVLRNFCTDPRDRRDANRDDRRDDRRDANRDDRRDDRRGAKHDDDDDDRDGNNNRFDRQDDRKDGKGKYKKAKKGKGHGHDDN